MGGSDTEDPGLFSFPLVAVIMEDAGEDEDEDVGVEGAMSCVSTASSLLEGVDVGVEGAMNCVSTVSFEGVDVEAQ
jgi:hypothetical protein